MRKLMIAGAVVLGTSPRIALAQAPDSASAIFSPTQGQLALPWAQGPATNNTNNAYAQPNAYQGSATFGKGKAPAPGTVVIRLNGRVEVDMQAAWSSNQAILGAKTNPVSFGSTMRLYPGIDGMATNGLRYGASIELRENFPGSGGQPTPALTPAPSASTYSSGETIFVRRAFAYLAADNVGLVRVGQGDGVIGLFDPCIFSAQCWDVGITSLNGFSLQNNGVTGATAVPFAWLGQSGAEYANTKIVYMSPQFFGFDFGVQYAPSMGNGFSSCTTAGSATCNAETTGADPTRWYNQVGVGARYQGVFGPVAVGVYAFYETAGKEDFFGAPASFANGNTAGNRFDNLSFLSAAAYTTVDTGYGKVTGSIDYIGGALNGQLAMRPSGGAPENAIVTGLLYNNGAITLGVQAGVVDSQGSNSLTGVSQRHEFELAVGGNYNLAPGLYLVGEYIYAQRHQGGFDFLTGANGAGATGVAGTSGWKAGQTRDTHGQGLMVSTIVNW